ncbi:sarcosine oxidase subunit gamma [Undibacterium arcticum]
MLKGYSHSPSGAGTAFKPYLQSPLHAFGLQAKARPQDDTCGVWMNEVPLLGYLVVRGDAQDAAFNAAVQDVLGVAPPTQPSSFIRTPHGVLLWQAPDEWLLVCARAQLANCLARLQAASDGLHAQMVDNSGGLTQVYLSGTKQLAVLHHVGVYDFFDDYRGTGSRHRVRQGQHAGVSDRCTRRVCDFSGAALPIMCGPCCARQPVRMAWASASSNMTPAIPSSVCYRKAAPCHLAYSKCSASASGLPARIPSARCWQSVVSCSYCIRN